MHVALELVASNGFSKARINGTCADEYQDLAEEMKPCLYDLAFDIELGNEPVPATLMEAFALHAGLSAAPTIDADWEVYDHEFVAAVLPEYDDDDDWAALTQRLLGDVPGFTADAESNIVTDVPASRWSDTLPGRERRDPDRLLK